MFCYHVFKNNRGDRMATVSKSVRIDEELWHRAKVKAMAERKTMQKLITQLLEEYLERKGGE
jgi:ribosomal protein L17